jgi:hypothetical protein
MRASGSVLNLAPWERIVALRKEHRLMSEYEQAHAVRSHGDREVESKWLVDQKWLRSWCSKVVGWIVG